MAENITDADVDRLAKAAVEMDLKKKQILGIPAIVYDSAEQKIYQVNSDGSRVVIGEKLLKGRYSERIRQEA